MGLLADVPGAAAPSARRRGAKPQPKSLAARRWVQIVLADMSMSLDNVLAVAGAARGHTGVLVAGLAVSVVLMAVAATLIARLLERYRWIAWVGLLIVLFVACKLIWKAARTSGRICPREGTDAA